jgi:hypothetical protein
LEQCVENLGPDVVKLPPLPKSMAYTPHACASAVSAANVAR